MSVIELHAPDLMYPNIYEPDSSFGQTRYGVSFDAAIVPDEIRAEMHWRCHQKAFLRATAKFPPTVEEAEGRYEELQRLYQYADVRNVQRGRCLGGPGIVRVEVVLVTTAPRFVAAEPFFILGLRAITVNVDAMWQRLHERLQ